MSTTILPEVGTKRARHIRFGEMFSATIREILAERGMTQKELSEKMGMPYSTLNKKLRCVHHTWWVHEFGGLVSVFDDEESLRRLAATFKASR